MVRQEDPNYNSVRIYPNGDVVSLRYLHTLCKAYGTEQMDILAEADGDDRAEVCIHLWDVTRWPGPNCIIGPCQYVTLWANEPANTCLVCKQPRPV